MWMRLAARGIRFTNAFVQGPVCGPSRMSYYTGRYVISHGAVWNFVPLSVGQTTLGDHLRPHGVRVALAGKTHMVADREGMARCGIDPASPQGVLVGQCGFEPFDRDDGLYPDGAPLKRQSVRYFGFLERHGYRSENPWHDFANSGRGPAGEIRSGWEMRWARLPAAVKEEHSETAYMTTRAMEFIAEQGAQPWCLHLSYIKPHWPYVAPAPYHDMYSADDMLPAVQDARELANEHPVLRGFRSQAGSVNLANEEMRRTVVPAYMGLVRQIDDHLGRLFAFLEAQGRFADTMIVFTSDHGDYLGDHYLCEKELFHDTVAKVPLIVYHPDAAATRGRVEPRLVEAIDIAPTILDAYRIEPPAHQLEGRSLLPLVLGDRVAEWRDAVVSEADYSFRSFVREPLGRPIDGCRNYMIRGERWKYIYYDGLAAAALRPARGSERVP